MLLIHLLTILDNPQPNQTKPNNPFSLLMKQPHLSFLLILAIFPCLYLHVQPLGSGSTISASFSSPTVCGIIAEESNKRIVCYQSGNTSDVFINPNISYDVISGGEDFFCGLRSGGTSLLCWDVLTFTPKRIYFNVSSPLRDISVGGDQVCGVFNGTNGVKCWRGSRSSSSSLDHVLSRGQFKVITSGVGFSCGILVNNSRVFCWGSDGRLVRQMESDFDGIEMVDIVAGYSHVCGFNSSGNVVCKGDNLHSDVPFNESLGLKRLALGLNYSCGIRQTNGSVVCWGASGYITDLTYGVSFETIVGGSNFICGLLSQNLSIICWGPGWKDPGPLAGGGGGSSLKILPGPCVESDCNNQCGVFPDSQSLCFGSGHICDHCVLPKITPSLPLSPPKPPQISPSPTRRTSKGLRKGLLAFAIVGSVGGLAGICTLIYCLYTGVCFGRKKIHNSVQPTITRGGSSTGGTSSHSPPSRSLTIRRQDSWALRMRRQRSGTSSTKHADRAEEFSFQELVLATDNFSVENRIGYGSFGVVYRGKLPDGREVAIKRGETSPKAKKVQEKETAFESELSFLSRLHHKHLVRLVGYCEERDERLLVYEYMKNGALHGHLHGKNNIEKHSSVINSWKTRIKIALDAARGIEYLHNYAVPPIIHRDIKSSNILLDATWTARVSDFGLSMLGPESDREFRPLKAAGTLGYIDPEYYGLNVLTDKSDVYGYGVVLLELLTGKRAIFKDDDDGGAPLSVVDFAVPAIMAGELVKILDPRVGPPEVNESEAVELVAYTAVHCVNLEGKDRPTMADIVANLESALALCEETNARISSAGIFVGSD